MSLEVFFFSGALITDNADPSYLPTHHAARSRTLLIQPSQTARFTLLLGKIMWNIPTDIMGIC